MPTVDNRLARRHIDRLTNEIRRYHQDAVRHQQDSVSCCREAGNRLIELKRILGHGKFTPWLRENFGKDIRTAQHYMKIATNWSKIEPLWKTGEIVTLIHAISALQRPKSKKLNAAGELLGQLRLIAPGLSTKEIPEQSTCFIFKDGNIWTYNDEVACVIPTEMKLAGAIQSLPLLRTLERLKGGEVSVSQNGKRLVVKRDQLETSLKIDPNILLPIDKLQKPTDWHPLPEKFAEAVAFVQECAGRDDQEKEVTCIHICPDRIDAFDRKQAARYRLKTSIKSPILVRVVALHHIVDRNMKEFGLTNKWIHFRNESGLVLSCRRYKLNYPTLDNVFNAVGTYSPFAVPESLATAIDRASVVFGPGNDDIDRRVTVSVSGGELLLESVGEYGQHRESFEVDYQGPPMTWQVEPRTFQSTVARCPEVSVAAKSWHYRDGDRVYSASMP